jgi:hypothetical protein
MTLQVSLALLFVLAWISIPVYANENYKKPTPPTQEQQQGQGQGQHQEQLTISSQGQTQATTNNLTTSATGMATNEGIDIDASDNSRVENNSSNTVLVPNNNTENCLRVFGIAWGKGGESGALGIPWRSRKCDFEQAADDAFAQGEREIGWFWKCENPNLYKSFKGKGESNESASSDCLDKMLGGMTATTTVTTMTKQIESMLEENNRQRALYREQSELIAQSCGEANDRVFKACQTGK